MKFSVLDQGIMVTQSQGLSAKGRHSVKYYSNWQWSEPCFADFQPGMGVENLEKVKNFFDLCSRINRIINLWIL